MSIEKKSLISTLKTTKKANTASASVPEASHVASKKASLRQTLRASKKATLKQSMRASKKASLRQTLRASKRQTLRAAD